MSQALVDLLREKFPDAVLSSNSHRGDEVVVVSREKLVEVIAFLRNDEPDLKLLRDIVAVDMLTYKTEMTGGGSISSNEVSAYSKAHQGTPEPRYYVAYNLYSITKKHSLRVRVDLKSTDLKIPSITSLYRTSDWWERYLFDMFGIEFEGHPNLQRLLMYPEFVGHPLRKDYPVRKRCPDEPDARRPPERGPQYL
jgi:NADH-quinone oxidoreductase subunit C